MNLYSSLSKDFILTLDTYGTFWWASKITLPYTCRSCAPEPRFSLHQKYDTLTCKALYPGGNIVAHCAPQCRLVPDLYLCCTVFSLQLAIAPYSMYYSSCFPTKSDVDTCLVYRQE